MTILDEVLDDIAAKILAVPPETGGALLGPPGKSIITRFIFDRTAATTTVTYTPSDELVAAVRTTESHNDLEFKGFIHSHPPSFRRPSGGDRLAVQSFFDRNPHRSDFLIPLGFPDEFSSLRRTDPAQALAGFKAVRRASSRLGRWQTGSEAFEVLDDHVEVIPVLRTATAVAKALAPVFGHTSVRNGLVEVKMGHAELFGYSVLFPGGDVVLLVGGDYPVCGPVVLLSADGRSTQQVPVPWHTLEDEGEEPAAARIAAAVITLARPHESPAAVPPALPLTFVDRETIRGLRAYSPNARPPHGDGR